LQPATLSDQADRSSVLSSAPRSLTVSGLSKTFMLPRQHYSTFKERALHPLRSHTYDELHAVDDVTFDIAQGEFFGIVGRNGSGKSTLLKCMAGIYKPDGGEVRIEGRLSPFIELGVGFNPDLTARDNVVINAIMLGLTRKQARERFDDIIAFAELEEFLDLKLKNYSSGMSVRLAFSVAIQVDADVLLVDEVLAVGDAAFQQKCFEQFHRLKDSGRTIVFVTHDMSAVERFCDRGMLLERGKIVSIDEPRAIARAYNELNFGRLSSSTDAEGHDRYGDQQSAEIRAAWFESPAGERIAATDQGEPIQLCMEVRFRRAVENPSFAMALRNEVRHTIFSTSTALDNRETGRFEAGEHATVRVALEPWLVVGRYDLTPSVAAEGGADVLDMREDLAKIVVHGTRHSGGIIEIPHEIDVERS
jgi:ABC-type polysaccharide/polyol phosphate transport system ATPase subunit